MGKKKKKSKDEMIKMAYELQDAIQAVCEGRRPWHITTNREHTIIRVLWAEGYEKRRWYHAKDVEEVIDDFIEKYGIHTYETTRSKDKKTSVWLTKKGARPKEVTYEQGKEHVED